MIFTFRAAGPGLTAIAEIRVDELQGDMSDASFITSNEENARKLGDWLYDFLTVRSTEIIHTTLGRHLGKIN